MSCRRNRLRKQGAEAKEGPLELWGEKGKGNTPGGREQGAREGVDSCALEGERILGTQS